MPGRALVLAALWCVLLATSVGAVTPAIEFVIPPGQEALIASMLGRGMALPDCTLISGGVNFTVIEATYSCVGGSVTLELDHPQNADTSAQTAQFAISVRSGTPPLEFQEALVSLVLSRENSFVWAWAESGADAESVDAPE
jgi:hypothetical protein